MKNTSSNLLLISCKNATELIDKKSILQLSIHDNVKLHIHTAMCGICKIYQKQSKILDILLRKHTQLLDENQAPQIINNELKKNIISKL